MATPNMSDPFFADIVSIFPTSAQQINAVNNYVTFQGTRNFISIIQKIVEKKFGHHTPGPKSLPYLLLLNK